MILNVYSQALILLGVGMITVFTILLLVVFFGSAIIRLVNTYIPLKEASSSNANKHAPPRIDNNVMAAIVASVTQITGGKGKVTSVEKI